MTPARRCHNKRQKAMLLACDAMADFKYNLVPNELETQIHPSACIFSANITSQGLQTCKHIPEISEENIAWPVCSCSCKADRQGRCCKYFKCHSLGCEQHPWLLIFSTKERARVAVREFPKAQCKPQGPAPQKKQESVGVRPDSASPSIKRHDSPNLSCLK